MSAKILVLYYSRNGSVQKLAEQIAVGIESEGAEALIRTVPHLHGSNDASTHALVTLQDLKTCDGLALGSPTRFGNMAAAMKAFWETTSVEWISGSLIDKPASVFTSSSSLHGGNEATLLSMMVPLLHHGMMILGSPYSNPELQTTQTGGTPYGPSHIAGSTNNIQLTKEELALCRSCGKRLAIAASKLKD